MLKFLRKLRLTKLRKGDCIIVKIMVIAISFLFLGLILIWLKKQPEFEPPKVSVISFPIKREETQEKEGISEEYVDITPDIFIENNDLSLGVVTADMLAVRVDPSMGSTRLRMLSKGSLVHIRTNINGWSLLYEGGYVDTSFIEFKSDVSKIINIRGDRRKSYLDYRVYKSDSKQKRLQTVSTTNAEGLRVVDGCYCVAVGTAIADHVGIYIDAELENGIIIPCIVGDVKRNIDTNASNTIGNDGSTLEFIIDLNSVSPSVTRSGDVSYAYTDWNSKVVGVKVYTYEKEL